MDMPRKTAGQTPPTVDRTDLFRPGAGGMPFFLAGRKHEQEVLARMMGELRRGKAPAHDAAIQGPRGVGKTALLNWAKREGTKTAIRGARDLRVVLLPSFALKTLPKLFRATLGKRVVTGSTQAEMWGRHALRTLGGHETRLTLAHVERARPAVHQLRNRYYAERWREIVRLRAPQAAALAVACADGARSITRGAAIDKLTGGTALDSARMSADDALENLRLLGYVAEGDSDGSIAAGIPSLMAYVRRRAAASVQP